MIHMSNSEVGEHIYNKQRVATGSCRVDVAEPESIMMERTVDE